MYQHLSVEMECVKPLNFSDYYMLYVILEEQIVKDKKTEKYFLSCDLVCSKQGKKLEIDNGVENSADNTLWKPNSWLSW